MVVGGGGGVFSVHVETGVWRKLMFLAIGSMTKSVYLRHTLFRVFTTFLVCQIVSSSPSLFRLDEESRDKPRNEAI